MEATLDNSQTKVFAKLLNTLSRMGEYLCVQFSENGLKLTTINKSKSSFARCELSTEFFSRYKVKRGFNESIGSSPRALKRLRVSILSEQSLANQKALFHNDLEGSSEGDSNDFDPTPASANCGSLFLEQSEAGSSRAEPPRSNSSSDSVSNGCRLLFGSITTIFKLKSNVENVERCVIKMDTDAMSRDRLVIQLRCKDDVLRTHRLFIESHEPLAAVYNKDACADQWVASSRLIGEWMHHFQSKLPEVTMFSNGKRLSFKSYSESLMEPVVISETLVATQPLPEIKRSLQTELKVAPGDFDVYRVSKEFAGLTFPLKELRALLALAEGQDLPVSAFFNTQSTGQPVIFSAAYPRQVLMLDVVLATLAVDCL